MDDQYGLANLDNLLLQLAFETRELSQKKDDLTHQIQMYRAGIQEKKKCIEETNKAIQKLKEDIQQKENTIKCYKDNVKSLGVTNDLLLQHEKMLEAELERRQESCNEDMKIFQERTENCWKIFQQQKDEYLRNPLATKLLKIQAEIEDIERRIQAKEEEIIAKQDELKALQEDTCGSVQKEVESNEQPAPPPEGGTQTDPQAQGTKTVQEDIQIQRDEKEDQADGDDESGSFAVGVTGCTVWTDSEIRGETRRGADPNVHEYTAEVDTNTNTSCGSYVLEEMMQAEEQKQCAEDEGGSERSAHVPSSPRAPVTPTLSLNSQSSSQGQKEGSFVFAVNSGSSTPTFTGFGCNFEVGPSQNEESPFMFSSSYFSKKSPGSNPAGFLFDESECHTEEDSAFPFSSKSPQGRSDGSGGPGDAFPFSFSFGKF